MQDFANLNLCLFFFCFVLFVCLVFFTFSNTVIYHKIEKAVKDRWTNKNKNTKLYPFLHVVMICIIFRLLLELQTYKHFSY